MLGVAAKLERRPIVERTTAGRAQDMPLDRPKLRRQRPEDFATFARSIMPNHVRD
jgi:hypothetical protein